ncbi:MAG: aspartate carbamoyltransferase catalytic subunit [Bacillota bacterium]|nr:aspartate carbamoyltransferase catalytic subunit [Bacillota bacterium]
MALSSKDMLGMKELPAHEIEEILNNAAVMKQILMQDSKKTPHLLGKSIVALFYENSTRTRVSFELAGKYMSAAFASVSANTSSVAKGETLIDTGKTLDMMGADIIIIRHPCSGAPHLLAKHVEAGVINAGDGMNEHPTQALLDMFTIREKLGALKGVKVAIVGDVLHSRVARSNLWGLTKMGARVMLAGPATLMPPGLNSFGAETTTDVREAVKNADVVMGLRIQKERQQSGLFPSLREYARYFSLNPEVISHAKPGALVMHPGPVNRGVEMPSSVADCEQSVIREQVTNGVAVRMALLYLMTRRGN